MSNAVHQLIDAAYRQLSERSGFVRRDGQVQLSYLISDLIDGSNSGAFEAPTGLGKSLACLIPAIAHAIVHKRRSVIATYTNILAEQYWQKDLPLALSLFEEDVSSGLLLGRQRYACLAEMDRVIPNQMDAVRAALDDGTENEFRRVAPIPRKDIARTWAQISVPPACPARVCPAYQDCYFFNARRQAEKAEILITNHSVVLTHALMVKDLKEDSGLFGTVDFLIFDEAHDLFSAAQNSFEIEVSASSLRSMLGLLTRADGVLSRALAETDRVLAKVWSEEFAIARQVFDHHIQQLSRPGAELGNPGILMTAPQSLEEHPGVKQFRSDADIERARELTRTVGEAASRVARQALELMEPTDRVTKETIRNYLTYFQEFGSVCDGLFARDGVSVSFLSDGFKGSSGPADSKLRKDLVDLATPLKNLVWDRFPSACVSATLALDGEFSFLERSIGLKPDFAEILPSPFDHASQAAVYLPKQGRIPDPTIARREGTESHYYACMAHVLAELIEACRGRTLALFHSRKEMEAVFQLMSSMTEYPILVQPKTGAASVGDRFKASPETSLFALRSFWTGFDAPGETLSCVALVRLPFDVPTEPVTLARMAHMVENGLDPFREHTLAGTKMLVRQGTGRLIRTATDRGVIAMLDPRLRTKRYGEEILANLPPEMRVFDDVADAVGWIGLE